MKIKYQKYNQKWSVNYAYIKIMFSLKLENWKFTALFLIVLLVVFRFEVFQCGGI